MQILPEQPPKDTVNLELAHATEWATAMTILANHAATAATKQDDPATATRDIENAYRFLEAAKWTLGETNPHIQRVSAAIDACGKTVYDRFRPRPRITDN